MKEFDCPFCENTIDDSQIIDTKLGSTFVLPAVDNDLNIVPDGIVVKVIECNNCHNIWMRNANY